MADEKQTRESVKPEEGLGLSDILQVKITQERVDRLKQLTNVDIPGVTPEVVEFLIRQQAEYVNIQYARFLSGTQMTESDVDEILIDGIDCHCHGGSDP